MPTYTPPLRDMQFVMHEVLKVTDDYKTIPKYAEADADTINAVLEDGGKFATEVTFPLNMRSPHPRASRRPTPSSWKAAGPRSVAIRPTAARACRWW